MCFQLSSSDFSQTDVWGFISQPVWVLAERIQSSTEHSLLPYTVLTEHMLHTSARNQDCSVLCHAAFFLLS